MIVSLLCGALGGYLGGLILKKYSLGTLWNAVCGVVGGGIGAQLLGGILGGGIVGQVGSGAIGGIVVLVIVALVKKALGK